MGFSFLPLIFLIGVGLGHTFVSGINAGGIWWWVALPASGCLALALWVYSPLPNHNGGFGLPPAKIQQWGWASEPAGEYEEPSEGDVMAPALGLLPVNLAKREKEND